LLFEEFIGKGVTLRTDLPRWTKLWIPSTH